MRYTVLTDVFIAVEILYLAAMLVGFYFFTRPVNWVDPEDANLIPEEKFPPVMLLYPVLRELEETMRTTFLGLQKLDYPADRFHVIAIPNANDAETVASLKRLATEFGFLEILEVPATTDPSWDVVWRAWDANRKAYWWHKGKRAYAKDLPPKKTRQLVYAFYSLIEQYGDNWLLDYIDADSVPPLDHLRTAAAGFQTYDVLQSTNVAGNLLDSWASTWHAMDHMAWDGCMYPHLTANGRQPFWVLGKGLFFMAPDLVEVGGFNPWITIEDPEVGMRLWKNGKRLGVIANPLIEEVPVTLGRGITQRKRWVCGFFQSLHAPLRAMEFTFTERLRARLNLVPCLSLAINPIGIPIGIWALVTFLLGTSPIPRPLAILSVVNIAFYAATMTVIYRATWRRTAMVLSRTRARLWYMLRVSPPVLCLYWLLWTVPIVIGFTMFVRDGGLVWERTEKIDANHSLVRNSGHVPSKLQPFIGPPASTPALTVARAEAESAA